jgi:copper chaperone CopZ
MITKFNITGMHCASCKALIEDACLDIAGVETCHVDPQSGIAIVEHTAERAAIQREIEQLGYHAEEIV